MRLESGAQFAWRRFSRGLPAWVQSVEDALGTGQRSFAQWLACLDAANHYAERAHGSRQRRSAIGSRREGVAWRSLAQLSSGEALTAEQIADRIGKPHVDVVRRGLKKFLRRRFVIASRPTAHLEARRFSITPLGQAILELGEGA